MSAFKPLLTTSAMILVAASFASSKDDSSWINSGIVAAIKNGQNQYVLPAGTYVLQNPVLIPPGTRNFTLKGAGSAKTILTNPAQALDRELMVGQLVQLHNNWNLTNRTNYAVSPVKQGDTTVKVSPSSAGNLKTNHYYVLWDTHTEWANNAKVTEVMNHAEIVKFTKVSSDGTAKLDTPAGREYDSSASIADVDQYMCQNVTVSGVGFDGSVAGSTTPSSGFMTVGLVDGISISDVTGKNFLYSALDFVNSRNVLLDHANLSLAAATGPGEGYGVCFSRCRFTSVTNSTSSSMRHGFIFHAGSLDGSLTNCTSTGGGGFDAHGMDDRRFYIKNCYSDDTFQAGNQAWPEGDSDITIDTCTFSGGLNACAYAKNLSAVNSNFGQVVLWSDLAGVTSPAKDQYPDNLSFSKCSFSAPSNLIAEPNQMGTATFSNCQFEATNTSWGTVLNFTKMPGTLNFSQCLFKLDSKRSGDSPVLVSTSAANFNLNMSACTLSTKVGANTSMVFKSGFLGAASIKNSVFSTVGAKNPVFLTNNSSTVVVSVNNSVSNGH